MSIQDENKQNNAPGEETNRNSSPRDPYGTNGNSGSSDDNGSYPVYEKNFLHIRATRMASTFFFTALVGLLFRTVIFPFIFAPLSIFFAYIGKGKRKKNDWYNNLFIGFSVIILIVNIAYCGYIGYSFNHDTKYHQQLDTFTRQMYGMSFDDYMGKVQDSFRSTDGTVSLPMPSNDALNSLMNEGQTAPAAGEDTSGTNTDNTNPESTSTDNTSETEEKTASPAGTPVADNTELMQSGGGSYGF